MKPAPTYFRPALLALLLTPLAAGLLAACQGSNYIAPQDYAAIDDGLIKEYIAKYQIPNAQRQSSGLYLVPDSVNNTLPLIANGRTVSVLYTGQLLNTQVFDASSQHGNVPFQFVLGAGKVIPGWDLGFALLHKGDKARLLIPSPLAYGGYQAGSIPPNSPLVFTVKVVDVQ